MSNPSTLFDAFGIPDDGTVTEWEVYEHVKGTLRMAQIRLNARVAELFGAFALALPRVLRGPFVSAAMSRWWCVELMTDLQKKYGIDA